MKLGFICPNVPGHLNPMTALARQLQARQHDVVFLYSSGATGLPFVRSPDKDHIIDNIRVASKLQGDDSLEFGIRILLVQTETILKSLSTIVQAHGIDALILDTVQFYAELGAIQLGMPYIHVSNALHFDYSGYTPLSIYGWPHQTTTAALARNRKGVARFTRVLGRWNVPVRAYAERFRLNFTIERPDRVLEVVGPTRIGARLDNHRFDAVAGGFQRHYLGQYVTRRFGGRVGASKRVWKTVYATACVDEKTFTCPSHHRQGGAVHPQPRHGVEIENLQHLLGSERLA